jgi:hypothetical protein
VRAKRALIAAIDLIAVFQYFTWKMKRVNCWEARRIDRG